MATPLPSTSPPLPKRRKDLPPSTTDFNELWDAVSLQQRTMNQLLLHLSEREAQDDNIS